VEKFCKKVSGMRVGIPRCFLYYCYYPLWKRFITELGGEIVLSPPTNKRIMENGAKIAIDDTCLPVKLVFGHVEQIKEKVDCLFIPRLVSVEKDAFTCPKMIGLPDIIRAGFAQLPPVIDTCFDLKNGISVERSFQDLGRAMGVRWSVARAALAKANAEQKEFEKAMERGLTPQEAMDSKSQGVMKRVNSRVSEGKEQNNSKLKIGLIGRSYNLYDDYVNMDLIRRLHQLNCHIVTAEMLPSAVIGKEAIAWKDEIFWTFGRKVVGAACHFFRTGAVDGVVCCMSFECGPDSLLHVLVEDEERKQLEIPLLTLVLDEHSAEAGIATRLEAFVDMIRRKRRFSTG
jgi:predicted nucleotide-binding protein (sugar kinase/HSP70/actin superfamily)